MMTSSVLQMLEGKLLDQGEMTLKQKAVLEAAIELFAEKGFASTSTSEIAKKAGVAEGTIFKYFETKEKLLYATILPILLHDLFPIQADIFREAVLEKEYFDFATFIDVLIDNRFAFLQENRSLFKILFTELMYREEIKQVFLEVFTNKVAGALEHRLEKMKAEKVIVNWDNLRIVRIILAQLLGYAVPRLCIFPDHQWDDKQELAIVKSNLLKILLLS